MAEAARREHAAALNWQEVALEGGSAHEYARADPRRSTRSSSTAGRPKPSEKTGNPMYVRPSVLVIYREDHAFLLDGVIPQARPGRRRLRPRDGLAAVARAHERGVQGQEGARAARPQPGARRAGCWPIQSCGATRPSRSSTRSGPARSRSK